MLKRTAALWIYILLMLPGSALAGNWGEEAWGTLVWGMSVPVPGVWASD